MSGHSLIVLDSFWGDSGKGRIAAYIAQKDNYHLAVRAGTGTNAGHSLYLNGKCVKTNQLPLAGILPNTNDSYPILAVGSGVCFDPEKAKREIEEYGLNKRVVVDYRCPVITAEHKKREAEGSNYSESHSGSTKSGTGEARVDYVRRIGLRAKDIQGENPWFVKDVSYMITEFYKQGKKIIIEGTQGHFLSLYMSDEYPVVTSDNCTTAAFADDVGLPWNMIDNVCMVIKSAPTRVSQNCGILPGEISKEEISRLGIEERGVTTGRVRRKSLTIPFELLDEAVRVNAPTFFALTFCEHVDSSIREINIANKVNKDFIRQFMPITFNNIEKLESRYNIPVDIIEYGKEFNRISQISRS